MDNNNQNNYNQSEVNSIYNMANAGANNSNQSNDPDPDIDANVNQTGTGAWSSFNNRGASRSNSNWHNNARTSNYRRSNNYQNNNQTNNIGSHNIVLSTTNARAVINKLMRNTQNPNRNNKYIDAFFHKTHFDNYGNWHLHNLTNSEINEMSGMVNKVRMDVGTSLDHFKQLDNRQIGNRQYNLNHIHYYKSRYASVATLNNSLRQNGVGDERNNNGLYRPNPQNQYHRGYNNRPQYQNNRPNMQNQQFNGANQQPQQMQNQSQQRPVPRQNMNQRQPVHLANNGNQQVQQPQNNGTRPQPRANMQNQKPIGHSFGRNSNSNRQVQKPVQLASQQQRPSKQDILAKEVREHKIGDDRIPF